MVQGWMERIFRYVDMLVILKMLRSEVRGEVWAGDREKRERKEREREHDSALSAHSSIAKMMLKISCSSSTC